MNRQNRERVKIKESGDVVKTVLTGRLLVFFVQEPKEESKDLNIQDLDMRANK